MSEITLAARALGVMHRADAGKSLAAGVVVRQVGGGIAGHDRLAGADLTQRIGGVQRIGFDGRERRALVNDDDRAPARNPDLEPVGRDCAPPPPVKLNMRSLRIWTAIRVSVPPDGTRSAGCRPTGATRAMPEWPPTERSPIEWLKAPRGQRRGCNHNRQTNDQSAGPGPFTPPIRAPFATSRPIAHSADRAPSSF